MWDRKGIKLINNYWQNICNMQKRQTEKGIRKYGQVLENNTEMSIKERLEYLQEELIDALMYIEHIKVHVGKEQEMQYDVRTRISDVFNKDTYN